MTPINDKADHDMYNGSAEVCSKPESLGLSSVALEEALQYLSRNSGKNGIDQLVITRYGQLVFKGKEANVKHGVWSITKTFTTTALGLLIDEGRVRLDTLAADVVPELAAYYPTMRLRHLASMTSGYRAEGDEPIGTYRHGPSRTPFIPATPLFTPPGSRFAYWDSALNELGLILTRIAGEPLRDLIQRRIGAAIGWQETDWTWGVMGEIDGIPVNGGAGNHDRHVIISAEALARWGQLFLMKGHWQGTQLISEAWVNAATSVQVPVNLLSGEGRGVYGFGWWVNGRQPNGERYWPNQAASVFAARGYNNNICLVVPEWHMVIVRMGVDAADVIMEAKVYDRFLQLLGQKIA
ncbi:MAG TPA: serine hydrolase [Firmicutes bacterium]|nr:serine hydrolase [Bacillota bacterium]